ncbi:hypothetical protein Murru_2754 [Allomuricauda ruestringensis DSM 13258]|uniref:Lipoprotein n=1 Tax=Allomuricauda ruestringensis (strain DSM 13258 / CIP 107369 / LMG 19739 / B1) TaxID=886377 RepID=G2PIN5_ALLRU|nr:hypothetical protein [Allomuricauda ruestringensis]AEM71780.1 hypothetical protein Murru_2754 [Allomuricauda ruestringensis DSM 13258]
MKTLKRIILAIFATFFAGCKVTSVEPMISTPSIDRNIIGSWEGCDGRVITFTNENNEIIGRYTKLGGLERYMFNIDEIGYKLTEQKPGTYFGTVKWQSLSGNETWKKVTVTIENNVYTDNQSDACSKEMERVKNP